MDKAIFLDRDGVINEVLSHRVKFVNQPNQFHLLAGVEEAISTLNKMKYKVFVVTNQGGVGLGYMKESELTRIHEKMKSDLNEYGAFIDDIAYCPHKPTAGCSCRKPEPGMLLRLAEQYNINLSESYMVGDRSPDIEAGKNAGTETILVGSRKEQVDADAEFQNLLAFANWLQQKSDIV